MTGETRWLTEEDYKELLASDSGEEENSFASEPEGLEIHVSEAGHKYIFDPLTGASQWLTGNSAYWESHIDQETNAYYYYNTETQEVSWEPPVVPSKGAANDGKIEADSVRNNVANKKGSVGTTGKGILHQAISPSLAPSRRDTKDAFNAFMRRLSVGPRESSNDKRKQSLNCGQIDGKNVLNEMRRHTLMHPGLDVYDMHMPRKSFTSMVGQNRTRSSQPGKKNLASKNTRRRRGSMGSILVNNNAHASSHRRRRSSHATLQPNSFKKFLKEKQALREQEMPKAGFPKHHIDSKVFMVAPNHRKKGSFLDSLKNKAAEHRVKRKQMHSYDGRGDLHLQTLTRRGTVVRKLLAKMHAVRYEQDDEDNNDNSSEYSSLSEDDLFHEF